MTTVVDTGLEDVVVAETDISLVDGAAGRLLYRGYEIGDLVRGRDGGTFEQVVELLLDGEWPADASLPPSHLTAGVVQALRAIPAESAPLDALRTAISAWGAGARLPWPPTPSQVRELLALAPAAVGAFARLRAGQEPVAEIPEKLGAAGRLLYAISGEEPDPGATRGLEAYFISAAEHGFNASTFTCRVIISTRSDLASAVCGAIGALKGPLHGGAPTGVEGQLAEIGTLENAEPWIRAALARGERIMGFGHRVYRTGDPRAAALREVAQELAGDSDWMRLAVGVEEVALRLLKEHKPDRQLPTNVDYYAAAVLQGVGLDPDLYPAAFAVARISGWGAHALEQAEKGRLIRPSATYVGPERRDLA
jgi:citrate synthase